jgi:diaminopimelate decarboxylase
MKPRHLLPIAAALCALAGCGNKGPLVRPSEAPPPVEAMPVAPPPAGDTLPELTPPAEPPVTDTVAPPPAQGDGG